MIQLQNVTKIFGTRTAVDNLSLSIPEGEIFGLLGHNGAGKSTTIGMLLGQVWPTNGKVEVCGFDVIAQRKKALRKVGAIFESPVFYDYLSGRRNLEILASYTAPVPKKKLEEVIEWVGLKGRELSKVRTYSHGMRARLALAQALLPEPKLLILDEPSDGLDPEGIHEMRHTILRLHREFGLTILLSSHLLTEVEQLCTRIAVLNKARLVFQGTIGEAKRKGARVRLVVDDFAGAIRLLESARLIAGTEGQELIELAAGIQTFEVVQTLTKNGFRVHEICHQEETLEEFYLSLMKKPDTNSAELLSRNP